MLRRCACKARAQHPAFHTQCETEGALFVSEERIFRPLRFASFTPAEFRFSALEKNFLERSFILEIYVDFVYRDGNVIRIKGSVRATQKRNGSEEEGRLHRC